jgi:hypothetical protein
MARTQTAVGDRLLRVLIPVAGGRRRITWRNNTRGVASGVFQRVSSERLALAVQFRVQIDIQLVSIGSAVKRRVNETI